MQSEEVIGGGGGVMGLFLRLEGHSPARETATWRIDVQRGNGTRKMP